MANPRGSNIEARRKRLGLKRSELARRVGLSYKTIYGLEKGFQTGAEETLQLIATELELQLEDVMEVPQQGAA
jgi:transcriptional regulator with XRE-family HTH domain